MLPHIFRMRSIDRRRTLAGLAALPLAGRAQATSATGHRDAWAAWKARFLHGSGRVVDDGNRGVSHSEGQAYGVLMAQAFGDREAFDRIEAWTQANLVIRDEALMAWRWEPGRGVTDWRTATDGDLFRAWALLRAQRDSGWGRFDFERIAADIAALCIGDDPRAEDEPVLLPGAEAAKDGGRVTLNPSYLMGGALREIGAAAGIARLIRAADHGETILAELAEPGPVPDWIDLTQTGFAPPRDHAFTAGYDALRLPLYLVWSGRRDHPAAARGVRALTDHDHAGQLAVRRTMDGQVTNLSDLAGYGAIVDLFACEPVLAGERDIVAQPYYPATLHMLALIAQREGGGCA